VVVFFFRYFIRYFRYFIRYLDICINMSYTFEKYSKKRN